MRGAASTRTRALALAGWTLFVWATRLRNAVGDDELSGRSKGVALTVAIAFILGAVAVLVAVVRRTNLTRVVGTVAAATIVYWPVRIVQIMTNGRSAGFVAVHAVLGLISIALAAWAWLDEARSTRRAGLLPGR